MGAKQNSALLLEHLLQLADILFHFPGCNAVLYAQRGGDSGCLTGNNGLLQEAVVGSPVCGNRLAGNQEVFQPLNHQAAVGDVRRSAVPGVDDVLQCQSGVAHCVLGAGGESALSNHIEELKQFADKAKNPSSKAKAYFRLAKQYHYRGDPETCTEYVRKAKAVYPEKTRQDMMDGILQGDYTKLD